MDCVEIRQRFVTGATPTGPAVDEHVKWCPHCAVLFRDAALLGGRLASAARGQPRDLDAQLSATEALLAHERGPRAFLRSRPSLVRWALLLALPGVLLGREALAHRDVFYELGVLRVLVALGLLALLAWVTRSALRPVQSGARAARWSAVLAVAAWCLPCALCLAPEAHANAGSEQFTERSLACFGYGSAFAAPSFALLWALDRGIRVPIRVWALAAGSVALIANLALLMHCASTNRAHLLAGHFSIGVAWFAAAAVGAWWARRET